MGYFVDGRKARFCRTLFANLASPAVFVDVGSGGPLKAPWTLLPPERVEKVDFDPEALGGSEQKPPLCISNRVGAASFYIARDPRGSSLHPANPAFIEWFDRPELEVERIVAVRCETLDSHFQAHGDRVDFLDINVEGHDFQVLQGSERLFEASFLKVVKIEFELAQVWQGQGTFGEIDSWMRQHGFEMIDLNFERIRPAVVHRLFHAGEPVWGKALYVPGFSSWEKRKQHVTPGAYRDDLYKAVGLYMILDAPGRAVELLRRNGDRFDPTQARSIRHAIEHTFAPGSVDFALDCAMRLARRLARPFKRFKIKSS